jgi:hypothetical protein
VVRSDPRMSWFLNWMWPWVVSRKMNQTILARADTTLESQRRVAMREPAYYRLLRTIRTGMDLAAGTWLSSAKCASGTSGLHSG